MRWRKDSQKKEEQLESDDGDNVNKPADEATPVPAVSFFQLFRYSTPSDIFLDIAGVVAAAAAGVAQPIQALLFGGLAQNFIGFGTMLIQFQEGTATADELKAAGHEFRQAASRNALYFVIAGIIVWACTFVYMYAWTYTSEINAKRIREHYLRSVLRQDVEFFDEVGAGEVATRIQSDTHLVQQGISEKVPMMIQSMSSLVAGFVVAFTQSWRLALAMCSIVPAVVVTGAVMGKFMKRYAQMSTDGMGSAGSIAEESISTIRTAKAFGIQANLGGLFSDKVDQAVKCDLKLAMAQGLGLAVLFFVNYASYGLAFSFGTTLINSGLATAGQVITTLMGIFIGAFSITAAGPEIVAITTAQGAAAKLFATIERTPQIDSSSTSGDKPSTIQGDIKLTNVSFAYPSRSDITVLQGINVAFAAGKSYALVGPSGSGKSTIVALLERFYDPKSGAVTLDGIDLKALNIKWLRSQIGLVSQEPTLFGTSIRKNVEFGLAGSAYELASDEEKYELVKQACIKANAHGFISGLPKGYDTLVGERGFMLSGGQKQRVAIARAIVSDPRILLLDEATSALDTQSEELVQDALSKASEGRTTVTIAHRLSTIKNADTIYVMSEGKVVEEGPHDALMSLDGVYARLVEAQGLKKQTGDTSTPARANTPIPQTTEPSIKRRSTDITGEKEVSQGTALALPEKKAKSYSMFYLAKRMGRLVKDKWLNFAGGWLLSIITGLVYPAFGIIYALSIEGFSQPDAHVRRVRGDRNALWFFIISIISGATTGGGNFYLASAAATLTTRLRKLSFRAVMSQDIKFFDDEKNTSGVLTSRINADPGKVNGFAGITLGTIIQSFSSIIAGAVLGLAIVWKVGLVGIACMPFLLSTGYTRLRVVMLKDAQNKEAHAQSAQIACESTAAIRTVAALTREEGSFQEYQSSLEIPLKRAIKSGALSTFIYAFSQAAVFFVIALISWYGSLLFSRLEITLFELFVAMIATTFGALQAGSVFQFAPDISAAGGAASDIITLLDLPTTIERHMNDPSDEKVPRSTKRIEGRIEARDIHFTYPTRPNLPVLKGVNFIIEPGQYVAFVGASGSGKSTIVQMLQRFYDVTSGAIYIDSHSLGDLNLTTYRQDVALVSQEPTLYSGSIRFNILLGATKPHSEVTQKEIEETCRQANILEFIQGLPDGFETAVGNKGSQLSGGQKQRIAIARALIRDPKILLLDEATSALDSASERVVQAALDRAAKGRTTIAIAHRLSTIQDADKIYFIKNGRISESGTHDELLSLRGDYYSYVQLQTFQQG